MSAMVFEAARLLDLIRVGRAELQTGPFGTALHASAYQCRGIPVVAVKNLGDNRLIHDDIPRVSSEDATRLERYRLLEGDIVFGRKGAVERRALIRKSEEGWLQGSDCIRLRFDKSVDPIFVSYFLGSAQTKEWLLQHAHGATMLSLNQEILGLLSIPLPQLVMQRSIAAVLSSFDDKIELNRRMNETLEGIARAMFRSWFVNFDPVRAKAGVPELPSDFDSLFPAALQDSAIGQIPEGWRVGRLEDLLVLQRGFDLPTSQRRPGPHPVIAASGPHGFHDQFMVRSPGVVTGRSGVIGKVFYVQDDFWPLNTALWIKEFKHSLPAFAYLLLSQVDYSAFRVGSVVPMLNRNHIHRLPVVIPPMSVIEQFENVVTPMLTRIRANERESETLASIRDSLLPKLLSGEVRVNGPHPPTRAQRAPTLRGRGGDALISTAPLAPGGAEEGE